MKHKLDMVPKINMQEASVLCPTMAWMKLCDSQEVSGYKFVCRADNAGLCSSRHSHLHKAQLSGRYDFGEMCTVELPTELIITCG